MDYSDFFEVSEIDELFEKTERRNSFSMYNQSDDINFLLCNIVVALSPHLSEEQEEHNSNINKNTQKYRPSCTRHKNNDFPVRVGSLSYEERQIKLKKYKEKKKNRVWGKKINYNCRKKVAENRLRIKGRFVTKEQALVLQKSTSLCDEFAVRESIIDS
jgi:uncharacterized protein YdiU (UPF0061 family)